MRASIIAATVLVLYLTNLTAGSITITAAGGPASSPLEFDAVRDAAFPYGDVKVQRNKSGDGVLVLKVAPVGDARPVGLEAASRFLESELGVRLVVDRAGAPIYFTHRDLAIGGDETPVGAAISRGMVIEVRDRALAPCVLAHEVGHLLGLHHHDHPANLMHKRCGYDRLQEGFVDEEQKRYVAEIDAIRLRGDGLGAPGREWAVRAPA